MKDITPRSEFCLHGALELLPPVEVSPELFFESTSVGCSVCQNQMWRCRGIWPVGILPHPWSFAERAIDPGRDSLSICLIVNPGWSRPVLIRVCRLLNYCVGHARSLFGSCCIAFDNCFGFVLCSPETNPHHGIQRFICFEPPCFSRNFTKTVPRTSSVGVCPARFAEKLL